MSVLYQVESSVIFFPFLELAFLLQEIIDAAMAHTSTTVVVKTTERLIRYPHDN